MSKLDTIKYQGNDYATVPVRLKEFREKNPRAGIITAPMFGEDGSLTFKVEITVDRADDSSATATGHAHYTAKEMAARKAFEKLETVATGRALSMLGYLNNGQVASTEEMLEFEEYRDSRQEEKKSAAIEKLQEAKTLDELKKTFISLGELMADEDVVKVKDEMKGKVSNADN